MVKLILVTGDKGGVGKSFLSRLLLDWFLKSGVSVRAFDTDKTNSTLYRFYPDKNIVQHLDVDQSDDLDGLLNLLAELAVDKMEHVVLLDCAARTLDALMKWMQDVDFASHKQELSIGFTIAFVMGPERDCVVILKDVANHFQSLADYVIIKNLAKGSRFSTYDESQTRTFLLETLKATEIELPKLLEKTSMVLDRSSLSFSSALDHTDVQIADRSRVRTYQERINHLFSGGADKWI